MQPLPPLPTLDVPPSWCKLNPRTKQPTSVDRSACAVIRVPQVRKALRLIPTRERIRRRGRYICHHLGAKSLPFPNERPARNEHGRVATASFVLTAELAARLHAQHGPRKLAGDWRTARANAMRPKIRKKSRGPGEFRNRYTALVTERESFDSGLDANPNRGAAWDKRLGLLGTWSQPIRVERWPVGAPELGRSRYSFICPCGVPASTFPATGSSEPDFRFPRLSTRPSGQGQVIKGCPQRVLFLMLPLCTPEEYRDAMIAQRWIDALTPADRAKQRIVIGKLIERYSVLFEPRAFVCRRCLGVRYGQHPDWARDLWRRKHGKV